MSAHARNPASESEHLRSGSDVSLIDVILQKIVYQALENLAQGLNIMNQLPFLQLKRFSLVENSEGVEDSRAYATDAHPLTFLTLSLLSPLSHVK